jgi:hypothetical protein
MTQIPTDAMLLYHRQGDRLRFKTENMTNHELRELMLGLWARLDPDDRTDHIKALQHYDSEPESFFSAVAGAISRGVAGENAVNLADVAKFGLRGIEFDE